MNMKSATFSLHLHGVTIEYDLSIYKSLLEKIGIKRTDYISKTDSGLQEVSSNLKNRVLNGESLECIYIEAFALVRETLHRVLHFEPFFAFINITFFSEV